MTKRRPAQQAPRARSEEATDVVYGLRAGLAVLTTRPKDVVRVAYAWEVREEIGHVLRNIAATEAPPNELVRLAQSPHHEGLCVVARPRVWTSPSDLAERLTTRKAVAIALDRVRNPYNVGAILRTAAFFGIDAVLLGAIAPHPALAADAVRVAEGGAEHLMLSRTTDLADTLGRLRARGISVVGADGRAKDNAFGFRFARPVVLVVGHEREGMSPRVRAQCDAVVAIRGAGTVESLNVAVATGALIAEIVRAG